MVFLPKLILLARLALVLISSIEVIKYSVDVILNLSLCLPAKICLQQSKGPLSMNLTDEPPAITPNYCHMHLGRF